MTSHRARNFSSVSIMAGTPKLPPVRIEPPIEILPPGDLSSEAEFTVDDQTFLCRANDLKEVKELGKGTYGIVDKMEHIPTGLMMAVKRITLSMNQDEQSRLHMDLDVSKLASSPYTVQFYGALCKEGDVWICMEVMDMSLDVFYPKIYKKKETIPEEILGKIALPVVKALHYLKEYLNVIHRDVKPSNILINRSGQVKICDFGISGRLVDSLAKTNAGCKLYMPPERVRPVDVRKGFDIRSDVWSIGITMVELAMGEHPYDKWTTPFEQLKQVVENQPPKLPDGHQFSESFENFITQCLQKDYEKRPKYAELLRMSFLETAEGNDVDVAKYFLKVLNDC